LRIIFAGETGWGSLAPFRPGFLYPLNKYRRHRWPRPPLLRRGRRRNHRALTPLRQPLDALFERRLGRESLSARPSGNLSRIACGPPGHRRVRADGARPPLSTSYPVFGSKRFSNDNLATGFIAPLNFAKLSLFIAARSAPSNSWRQTMCEVWPLWGMRGHGKSRLTMVHPSNQTPELAIPAAAAKDVVPPNPTRPNGKY
jgi:hypothetical protein